MMGKVCRERERELRREGKSRDVEAEREGARTLTHPRESDGERETGC
jgi:hypothetical protein